MECENCHNTDNYAFPEDVCLIRECESCHNTNNYAFPEDVCLMMECENCHNTNNYAFSEDACLLILKPQNDNRRVLLVGKVCVAEGIGRSLYISVRTGHRNLTGWL